MASNLRDIPGANRRASSFRRKRPASTRLAPPILIDPRAGLYDGGRAPRTPRRPALHDRPRRLKPVDLVLGALVLLVVGFLGLKLWSATRVDVQVTGIEDD